MQTALRAVGGLLGALVGFQLATQRLVLSVFPETLGRIGLAVIVALLGWLLSPWLWRQFVAAMDFVLRGLARLSLRDLALGVTGLIVGLLIAFLVSLPLGGLPFLGPYLRPLAALVFGYLGIHVALQRREEVTTILPRIRNGDEGAGPRAVPKVLDTSVIIDGRIADVCRTGFVDGPLLVPRFVLQELQRIADSADPIRRARGRRGLDVLNTLQKEFGAVRVVEEAGAVDGEVDARLVAYARSIGAAILTNDLNLNKVAELEGVRVLNINELAQALRPILLPGETLSLQILREGKEAGQGVGYLEDGTMVVVEGGRRLIGEQAEVVVTSVLQTVAGRMIFARPRSELPAGSSTVPRR